GMGSPPGLHHNQRHLHAGLGDLVGNAARWGLHGSTQIPHAGLLCPTLLPLPGASSTLPIPVIQPPLFTAAMSPPSLALSLHLPRPPPHHHHRRLPLLPTTAAHPRPKRLSACRAGSSVRDLYSPADALLV